MGYVHHCMSSAYHPILNGRAELQVKSTKRSIICWLNDLYQYVVKVDESGCLTLRNRKFQLFKPPGCKTLGSVLCQEKTNIAVQKSVIFADHENQEKLISLILPLASSSRC